MLKFTHSTSSAEMVMTFILFQFFHGILAIFFNFITIYWQYSFIAYLLIQIMIGNAHEMGTLERCRTWLILESLEMKQVVFISLSPSWVTMKWWIVWETFHFFQCIGASIIKVCNGGVIIITANSGMGCYDVILEDSSSYCIAPLVFGTCIVYNLIPLVPMTWLLILPYLSQCPFPSSFLKIFLHAWNDWQISVQPSWRWKKMIHWP